MSSPWDQPVPQPGLTQRHHHHHPQPVTSYRPAADPLLVPPPMVAATEPSKVHGESWSQTFNKLTIRVTHFHLSRRAGVMTFIVMGLLFLYVMGWHKLSWPFGSLPVEPPPAIEPVIVVVSPPPQAPPPPTTPLGLSSKAYIESVSKLVIAKTLHNTFVAYTALQWDQREHITQAKRIEDYLLHEAHLDDMCASSIELDPAARRYVYHITLRKAPPPKRMAPPAVQTLDMTPTLSDETLELLASEHLPKPKKIATGADIDENGLRPSQFIHLLYPSFNITEWTPQGGRVPLHAEFISPESPLHCTGIVDLNIPVSLSSQSMYRRNHGVAWFTTLQNKVSIQSFSGNHAVCLQHYESVYRGNWTCSNTTPPPGSVAARTEQAKQQQKKATVASSAATRTTSKSMPHPSSYPVPPTDD